MILIITTFFGHVGYNSIALKRQYASYIWI